MPLPEHFYAVKGFNGFLYQVPVNMLGGLTTTFYREMGRTNDSFQRATHQGIPVVFGAVKLDQVSMIGGQAHRVHIPTQNCRLSGNEFGNILGEGNLEPPDEFWHAGQVGDLGWLFFPETVQLNLRILLRCHAHKFISQFFQPLVSRSH